MSENVNITEAKNSLKYHIKFFESLLQHVRRGTEPHLSRSMWAAWCLHRYINDQLMNDIEKAMREFGDKKTDD